MQPPQNPYSNPGQFNSPGPSTTGPSVSNSRGPEISFDAIGQAWKLLQPNLGVWIGAAMVYGVITILLQIILGVLIPKDASGNPQLGLSYWVFMFIGLLIAQFIFGGLMRMAINNVRTGRAEFGQLFSAGDVLPKLIGAAILTYIATTTGLLFCIAPGLLLSGLWMFVTPLIVDKKQGAIEAMSTSFNALKSQMWMALIFVIVVGLLAGAGVLACGVGVLVTAPLAILTVAVTYNNFFSNGQFQNSAPIVPSAPIADPFK